PCLGHLSVPATYICTHRWHSITLCMWQVCRTSMLGSVLKMLAANVHSVLPIKLFEVGNIVLLDPSRPLGARYEWRLVAVYCDSASGMNAIQALLDRVMGSLVWLRGGRGR
ncbi:hypothetical protein Vretifemale_10597, partial [Volvox reticuliferus]